MARTRRPSDVAREKEAEEAISRSQEKARSAQRVTVQAVKSFNEWRIGQTAETELTETILGLVAGGFLEVTDHGTDQAGPGAVGPDHSRGGAPDDPGTSAAGTEPGQGFGAGGYGTAES